MLNKINKGENKMKKKDILKAVTPKGLEIINKHFPKSNLDEKTKLEILKFFVDLDLQKNGDAK